MRGRLPLSRFLGRWALIFGAATVVGFFFATRTYFLYNAYPDNEISWGRALAPSLTSWYAWALLAPAILWLASRFRFERSRWGAALAAHLLAGVAFALLHTLVDHLLGRTLPWLSVGSLTGTLVISRFHGSLLTYLAIVGVWNLIDAFRRERERRVRASQLETRLAEARLQALKMQLHPHFLFNTLHAISALMHRDVEAADRMLAQLSDLLRLTLENAGAQEVSLKEELDFLERYLEIERARFGERLTVELDVDPEVLDARVPNLILQPLVENAIRHGIAPRAGSGWIGIRASRRDRRLVISVEDDGPGLRTLDEAPRHVQEGASRSGTGAASESSGVGLANCRARLKHLYGPEGHFELREAPAGGLLVSVEIPLHDS